MPPPLAVAADIGRSPTQSQIHSQLSPHVGTRRTPKPKRDVAARRRLHLVDSPVNRGPWIPAKRNPQQHQHTPAPPPSQLYGAIAAKVDTGAPSSFALRDHTVEKFEAGLQKQGSLSSSGMMSSAARSPSRIVPPRVPALALRSGPEQRGQSSSHEPFTPTSPAFYPSPTSPSTSVIPLTPSLSRDSWRTPSPSKYVYAAQPGDRTAFAPSRHCPHSRRRSLTTSSIPSPYRLSPVALPIGRKLPKWREVYQERALDKAPSKSSDTAADDTPSRSSESSSSPYRRPNRAPLGPRPMVSRSSPYARGLCIAMPRLADDDRSTCFDDHSTSEAVPEGMLDPEVLRKREQVQRWLGSTTHACAPDRPESIAEPPPDEPVEESAPEDGVGDEAESHSSSDDDDDHEHPLGSPFTPSSAWTHQVPGIAIQINPSAPPLDAPFGYDAQRISMDSRERSAFDSDTEDEDDMLGHIRISKFSRLRRALKSSISVPNIAGRMSLIGASGLSSLETSPVSVAALRARQTTASTTSPPRNPYILKVATDMAVLSPVAPSPADVNSPESQADGDAPPSPSTPATPASPKTRQTRSFIFEMSKVSLVLEAPPPPPLPDISRCHGPPNAPLPPTPPFASTPSLPLTTRPAPSERGDSFVKRSRDDADVHDRLTVVDPDISMARLQETMAKLEAYAPRASHETDASSPPSNSEKPLPDIAPFAQTGAELSVGAHRTGRGPLQPNRGPPIGPSKASQQGVLVFAIEPARSTSAKPEPRPSSREDGRPPSVPPKPGNAASRPVAATQRDGQHARRPSVPLLPLFDFERPGHQVFDLQGLPMRTASLQSAAQSPREAHFPAPDERTPGPPGPVPPERPAVPRARAPARQPATPPSRAPERAASEGVSWSHFSPESPSPPPPPPKQQRGSRVRRLLGVRTELMRGLRGSFIS